MLIIDDDQASARLVGAVLAGPQWELRTAGSAEDALVALETFRPDAIVLDLVLPLMSGLLLTQQLRTRPAFQGTVIVAVTAFNGPEARRLALEAGCTAYVKKPIDALAFADTLRTLLETHP